MKQTHEVRIIILMFKKGRITASMVPYCSNPNAFFCNLEKAGICQSEWGFLGDARIKWRWIRDEKKALEFLSKHRASKPDPVIYA